MSTDFQNPRASARGAVKTTRADRAMRCSKIFEAYSTHRQPEPNMSTFRQNADLRNAHINRRAEAAYGFLLAIAIGIGLAAALVYGWSL